MGDWSAPRVGFQPKRNLKALHGIDAITGKSNFDLGEAVLLRMLDLFLEQRGTLAMLCKNSVIKNIVEILPQRRFKVSSIRAIEVDAGREFGAAVDASLLVVDLGVPHPIFTCDVSRLDCPNQVSRVFGWTHSKFVSRIHDYESTIDRELVPHLNDLLISKHHFQKNAIRQASAYFLRYRDCAPVRRFCKVESVARC